MDINWFPGHMAKTLKNIEKYLALVDMVIETADARIPRSSRNPELDTLLKDRDGVGRILFLNKRDLADAKVTADWLNFYSEQEISALAGSAKSNLTCNKLLALCRAQTSEKFKARAANNRGFRPLRIMVIGIPNSGKSTLINTLSGRKAAKTSNKPGVTRGPQWIKTNSNDIELLDMPGVLWPKLETKEAQTNLALTSAINDNILPLEELAFMLFKYLLLFYPQVLHQRYKLNIDVSLSEQARLQSLEDINYVYDLFLTAGKNRGCLMSGGQIDENRLARLLITEFRNGILGEISLERPEEAYPF